MKKVALITGITGQDGSFLAEFLIEKVTKCMALCVVHHHSTRLVSNICTWMNGCAT